MSDTENTPSAIEDEDLPEDLRPTDDNPLAQPLEGDEAKSPEELDMHGGKTPDETEDPDEADDTDDAAD